MVKDYIFDKTFDKIEEIIDIIKLESINDINSFYWHLDILIYKGDKLANYVTLKNVAILIACIIKCCGKFYSQIFLEESFYNK